MPNLHELLDAATDGLPPLPDLAPSARRIVRRRRLAARTTAAVLSSALAIGAGTFTLSMHNSSRATDADNNLQPAHAYSNQYVLDILRSLWPLKNQQLTLDPTGPYAIIVTQDGRSISRIYFEVIPDIDSFPGMLGCSGYYGVRGVCIEGKADDGDPVLTSISSAGRATFADAYRLRGSYLGLLEIQNDGSAQDSLPTNQQLFAMMKTPGYESLIVSAIGGSSFGYLGTPPAGVPSLTYGPSPSGSTPGSGSASATPSPSAPPSATVTVNPITLGG